MRESTPQERFDRYVHFVRDGQTFYEREARELAAQHGFPLQELEDALPVGIRKVFDRYVHFVRDGQTFYEREARELAAQHGFPLQELEDALPVGKKIAAEIEQRIYGKK